MPNNANIVIKGARVNNLKNINISLPRDTFIVFTGLSGSGKSSLAFDTIYAEGQRRYVESLSSYARQFLGRMHKPDVDFISGIPPAIAIEQKVNTRNPRSTVGTSTEIYDYLKLLYARIGRTYSPVSGKEVKHHTVTDVVSFVEKLEANTKVLILTKFFLRNEPTVKEELQDLLQKGNTRIEYLGEIMKIKDVLKMDNTGLDADNINIVIDRLVVNDSEDFASRVSDSVQSAFYEGEGICLVKYEKEGKYIEEKFSNRFEADSIQFEPPHEQMFNFNNPVGACKRCEGYGQIIGIDENLVIPDKNLSVYEDAVACWRGDKMKEWKDELIYNADRFNFPVHKPYYQLSDEHKKLLWTGNQYFHGLNKFFRYIESKIYKIQYRVLLSRYRGKTVCPECHGARLKKEASYVKIGGKSIDSLVEMPISNVRAFFEHLSLTSHETAVSKRLLKEISNRIHFLCNVGLGYLTLNRLSSTLSGGESQRINLATSLGSSLVGSLYILDEPSIGLHPRDNHRLIRVLQNLKNIGNTVLVVEHDKDIIKSADQIVDIGPEAGRHGGEITFQGDFTELLNTNVSLTTKYMTGEMSVPLPAKRRKWQNYIEIKGAYENNLKNIDVKFPLNVFTVITGVSGSGKSTLVRDILYSGLKSIKNKGAEKTGKFGIIEGNIHAIENIEFINQNPIGKSSRSNPVTYIKAYDEIRKLYAQQQLSRINNFKPAHFSFNTDGGRCEECQGEGIIKVEMQFMADVELICESCKGKRFKDEVLEVKYEGKNISDILEMTVNEAIDFFSAKEKGLAGKVAEKLKPLAEVGLGYVKLGQSSSTLSGGESQRVKLASFLSKEGTKEKLLFIFDEPTTGLHFHDINKLLSALNALIKRGHSVILIEHNMDIIKSADWVIDLGPEGGEEGGYVVFKGTPEQLMDCGDSYTGKFLKQHIDESVFLYSKHD